MTDGILHDPQEGESAFIQDDLTTPAMTPLERAQKSAQEFDDIVQDPERRAALIDQWMNR